MFSKVLVRSHQVATARRSFVSNRGFKSEGSHQRRFTSGANSYFVGSSQWKAIFGLGVGAIGTAYLFSQQDNEKPALLHAETEPPSEKLAQPTVITGNLVAGGFLIIHLNKNADLKKVAAVASSLPSIATEVAEGDPIYAGVAFGTKTWEQVAKLSNLQSPSNLSHHKERKGSYGGIPNSGGDILVHVKAGTRSQAFEVIHAFVKALPAGSIASIDDEYGWHYQDSRDLSGFIDGTENVAEVKDRRAAALLPTGGSYVIHQRWIHDLSKLHGKPEDYQEKVIGRSKPDSSELSPLPISSHVARSRDDKGNKIPIVRQSLPFGNLKGPHGLLFIAYANAPQKFDVLLDRMTGHGNTANDDVMSFSNCVASQYYYVPSVKELASLA
jgi:putative iron-dependent peroxidase